MGIERNRSGHFGQADSLPGFGVREDELPLVQSSRGSDDEELKMEINAEIKKELKRFQSGDRLQEPEEDEIASSPLRRSQSLHDKSSDEEI